MKETGKTQQLWSWTFIIALIINVFSSVSMYMTNPIMTDCLLEKGVPFAWTGIISSVISWISLLFRPVSGWASDNYNKKRIMLISHGVTAVCMFMYTLAPNVASILIVRILHGIAFGFTATLSLTFAVTFIEKEILAEGLAYLSLGQLLGSMLGPQVGATIAERFSIRTTFAFSGILSAIAFVLIFLLPYSYVKAEKKQMKVSIDDLIYRETIPFMILICIFSIGNSIISYYLKNFGDVRGIANVTLFFMVNSIAMAAFKPFSSKVHDQKGIAYVMYPSFVVSAISFIVLAHSYTLVPVLLAAVLKAVSQGVGSPALQAESAKIAGEGKSGAAISTCLSGQDIGNAIGPVIGSAVIAQKGYGFTYYALAGLTLLGLAYFIFYYKNTYINKFKMEKEDTNL
ncbi:MAG: MFS transporter [Erysipelotrichaceae bacterium]|nr:MFS transporter [Erysipelotrichaceae bacterium]